MANEVTITWTLALLIASVLVILLTQWFSKKASTRKTFLWIGGIGAVAMVLALVFGASLPESLAFLSTPVFGKTVNILGTDVTLSQVPSASPVIDGKCVGIEDTTITLTAQNKFTSVATGGSHRYRINGNPALTVSDAGTFTASPGDKIQILWFNGSSTGAYYSDVDEVVVPCSGTKTFSKELVQNGTVTYEVFNEEGNLISNDAGENETLSAGDVVTLTAKLKGTYQRGIPFGGVVVVEFNKSSIDDVIVDLGGSKVATPQVYTATYGATSSTRAYSVPSILSNQILQGSIVIDADDTTNPSEDVSDIVLTFYPTNYYINEDNAGAFEGPAVEDEKNARTYGHATTFTISVD